MKKSRLLILGTALVAGIGAAMMVAGSRPSPVRQVVAPPRIRTDDVLVAAKNIPFGGTIENGDLRWQSWPQNNVPPNVIRKTTMPNALASLDGSLTRDSISAGEPIYPDRLIQPGKSSFLAAILTAGKRAVAINIDSQGATTAGGFILPNDHVDVIHTFKDTSGASADTDGIASETILRNVRVLAIGPNLQQQGDQRVAAGSTATLELTPSQVETIVLAQRTGQLSLSLRSMADTSTTQPPDKAPGKSGDMTIVRFGVPVQTRTH